MNTDRRPFYRTPRGTPVPAVTAAEMRRVDDLAVGPYRLSLLQMMENAGRNLALQAIEMLAGRDGMVIVLAGPGGNGGGGLCAARHLHNHGVDVCAALSHPVERLSPAAVQQWHTLRRAGVPQVEAGQLPQALQQATLVVDAMLGYSLRGALRPPFDAWVNSVNAIAVPVLSLDVPTGLDATTGEAHGQAIQPSVTLTLALPKTGLRAISGGLVLADIGIPPALYQELGLPVRDIFAEGYRVPLRI